MNLTSTRRRHGVRCAVLSTSVKDRSHRAPWECATGVENALDENQRRRFQCVWLSSCARGEEKSVPPKSLLLRRYQAIYPLNVTALVPQNSFGTWTITQGHAGGPPQRVLRSALA